MRNLMKLEIKQFAKFVKINLDPTAARSDSPCKKMYEYEIKLDLEYAVLEIVASGGPMAMTVQTAHPRDPVCG